jgi:RNA recognition motif-containing protein
MNTKLFVGNLSFDTTELDLQDMFAAFGPVSEVNLVTDRVSGRPRGFAFVTMATRKVRKRRSPEWRARTSMAATLP